MFELKEPTKAKITEIDVLSDKDRAPDDNPGSAITFNMTVGNDVLIMFDGFLRGMLYSKSAEKTQPQQQGLDGVAKVGGVDIISDMPKLTTIGMKLREFAWDLECTGYTAVIDHGMGGPKSNIQLNDGKLSNFKIFPKEGGSTGIKFRAEFPDINAQVHGKLALLKSQEVLVTFDPPQVDGQDTGGTKQEAWPFNNPPPETEPPKKGKKALTPEQALTDSVAGGGS